jgi:hypothetical protein
MTEPDPTRPAHDYERGRRETIELLRTSPEARAELLS